MASVGDFPSSGDSGIYCSSSFDSFRKGSLIVHGTNGRYPSGNRGRKSSRIDISQRSSANGVKPGPLHPLDCDIKDSQAKYVSRHTAIWKLADREVVQDFVHDPTTDLFQIGRGSDLSIDMVVIDTNDDISIKKKKPSAISRFACRLTIRRDAQPTDAYLYASCFDEKRSMRLGAIVWEEEGEVDALTTNGVLVLHIQGDFMGGNATPGLWREVSVNGDLYSIRQLRSATQKGRRIPGESNRLKDGSMIDLCGVTLLWRTPESLAMGPAKKTLEDLMVAMCNKGYICPQSNAPLIFKYGSMLPPPPKTPHVFLGCGHVSGRNLWGNPGDEIQCPVCQKVSTYVNLTMGMEPALWVDMELPTHAFNPCGHMASEKTIKYWSKVPLPRGTNGFIAACPFCATPLVDYPGYCTLLFTSKPSSP